MRKLGFFEGFSADNGFKEDAKLNEFFIDNFRFEHANINYNSFNNKLIIEEKLPFCFGLKFQDVKINSLV